MQHAAVAAILTAVLLGCQHGPRESHATTASGGQDAGGQDAGGQDAGGQGGGDPFAGEWSTGIFSADLDGSNVRALYKGDEVLAAQEVAPGGDRLAMVRFPPGSAAHEFTLGAIAVMDLTEPEPEPEVVFDAEGVDALPSWSPDGQRLVFVSQCAAGGQGSQCLTEAGDDHLPTDLFVLDVASGVVQQLTHTAEQSEGDPHWASAEVVLFTRVSAMTGMPEVWSLQLTIDDDVIEVVKEKRITEPPPVTEPFAPPWGPGDFDPHLNPEGTMIAFERHQDTAWTAGGLAVGDFDVLVLDLTQNGATHVPDDTHDADIRPVWAPGGWLAFYRGFEQHGTDMSDVMVMKQDGSVKMNITAGLPVANETWPHWIPRDTEPVVDGVPDLVFIAHPYEPPCELLCALAADCSKTGKYGEGCLAWCQQAYGEMIGSFESCASCASDPAHSCDDLFPNDEAQPGVCHQACQP